MTPLMILLATGILALVGLLVYEGYLINKNREATEALNVIAEEYITGFQEVMQAVNVNAGTLRTVVEATKGLDHDVAVLGALVNIHSTALQINPELRGKIESSVLDNLDIRGVTDDDSNS